MTTTTTHQCVECSEPLEAHEVYTDPFGRGDICGPCGEHYDPKEWTKHSLRYHLLADHDPGYYITAADTKAMYVDDHHRMHAQAIRSAP